MHEENGRVCGELTAMLNGRLERELMSAEPLRPDGRKNLLASDPRYRPEKKSGNNAQNDSYHRFLLFISSAGASTPEKTSTASARRCPLKFANAFSVSAMLGLTGSEAPLQFFPARIALQRCHHRFKF